MVLPVAMAEAKEQRETFFLECYIVELPTQVLYLVAADEDIAFDGQVYSHVPIKRGDAERSVDSVVNECDIELSDADDDLLAYLLNGYDFRGARVTIFRIMYPESLTNPGLKSWIFSGEVDAPSFSDGVLTAKLTARFPAIDVPLRDYRLHCNNGFGDAVCGKDKGQERLTVLSVAGNVITVPTYHPRNHWTHGTISVGGEVRGILKSEGNSLTVNISFLQSIVGKEALLTRGCDKTADWCRTYYDNMRRFSGFPAIPFENIYR